MAAGGAPTENDRGTRAPEAPGDDRVSFGVLGPLAVDTNGQPVPVGGPKERQVLALLLTHAPHTVSIDALADGLWSGWPPRSAERTIHAYVARLRRALEPNRDKGASSRALLTDGRGYRLALDPQQIDAARFEELAQRGAAQLHTGDAAAAETLRRALDLWRGEAYAEFVDVEPCAREGRRLAEIRLSALEDRVDADLADGTRPDLVAEIDHLLADHPFRERLWGQLMLALYRAGRQGDALDAYQRARTVLVDELGLEPGPELRRLEAGILAQDPALDAPGAGPVPAHGRLPLALEAVGPAFVGRAAELAWLRSGWETAAQGEGRFLSLLGPEGIGKTRLVTELARQVHPRGAVVLYARCDHAHRGARALLDQALRSGGAALSRLDDAGTPLDGLAGAFARYLPTWSLGRPVLVVLDDLHLADTATLEVVADLAGWCAVQPMLVVAAFRSDAERTGVPLVVTDDAAQLVLGGIDRESVGRICLLYREDGWTTDDVGRLHEVTHGVPLHVHEQASEWARQRTARQVEAATGRLSGARDRLVESRAEVADGVEGIVRLLEERRSQLAGRVAPASSGSGVAVDGCPYKGLARFEAADAANFFGRERLVAELVARLAVSRLLAVVGPSGSGKSSVVRAGVLPALDEGVLAGTDRWRTITMCPGAHPDSELARRMRSTGQAESGDRIVVFVDQFEETFTHCGDEAEQGAFVERLVGLLDNPAVVVVLAVRADHLGACAAYPALADLMTGNDVLVGPMREPELRRAIEHPAAHAGLELEPGLADIIVADVAGRAGALPLLSTALAETWERRQGRTLTRPGYRAAGGVNGALARMAEDAYLDLGPAPRAAARRVLMRLCDAGEEGVLDLRRRLATDEAAPSSDHDARIAVEVFVERRLLTIDQDTVEVAHEALLREWPRLRGWLAEDVEGRRVHRRLGEAARSWEEADRDPSELYRGTRLDGAVEWAAGHDVDLNEAERRFLDASRAEADREVEEVHRRVREKVKTNRRLRGLLGGVGVLLVLALVAGGLFLGQRDRAERETREATARELAADATLALEEDPELGMLLGLEAIRATETAGEPARPEAIAALHTAVQASRLEFRLDGGALYVDASDDGTGLVSASAEGDSAIVWDAATGDQLQTLTGPIESVSGVALSPDASRVAVAYGDEDADGPIPAVIVWDAATGAEVSRLMGPAGWYGQPVFSPDGRSLAASGGAWISVWDVASGTERSVVAPAGGIFGATFSGDGSTLIVAEFLGEQVGFYSAEDGHPLDALRTPGFTPEYPALDPTGTMLALSSQTSRSVQVWNLATRQLARVIPVGDVADIEWSPDGGRLAVTGGNQGQVRIVDVASGEDVMVLRGHIGNNWDAAFLGDGERVASIGGDLRIWDVTTDGPPEVGAIAPATGLPGVFEISGDGSEVVVSMRQGDAEILSTMSGEPLHPPIDQAVGAFFTAPSPDGRLLAVNPSGEGPGAVVDRSSMTPVMDLPACASPRSFSPDGSLVLVSAIYCTFPPDDPYLDPPAGADLRVRVVEVGSGRDVLDLSVDPEQEPGAPPVERSATNGVFNPEGRFEAGRYLAVDVNGDFAEIYDVVTGEYLTRLPSTPGEGLLMVKMDPQGRWVAGGQTGGRSWVLDLEAVVNGTPAEEAVLFDRITHDGSTRVALHEDGILATAGNGDGLVRLWDIATNDLLLELRVDQVDGPGVGSPWLGFSPDGSYLLYADGAGLLRKYFIDTDRLVELAERRLTRGLTADECARHLQDARCEELALN